MMEKCFDWVRVERDFAVDGIDLSVLPPFWISRHRVRVDEYGAFCRSTGYRTTAQSRGFAFNYSSNPWLDDVGPARAPVQPALFLSFVDASAYCEWASVRLPTEQEWVAASLLTPTRIDDDIEALSKYYELLSSESAILDPDMEFTSTLRGNDVVVRRGPHLLPSRRESVWEEPCRWIVPPNKFYMLSFRVCM